MLRNPSVLFSWARKQHKIAANPCSGNAAALSAIGRTVYGALVEQLRADDGRSANLGSEHCSPTKYGTTKATT